MNVISLTTMTQALARKFFSEFQRDPATFVDMQKMKPYVYDESTVAEYVARQAQLDRTHFAIILDEEPIGEILLKSVDLGEHSCILSIHLKNDSVKSKGYGTQAQCLTLDYAFNTLGMILFMQTPFIRINVANMF